MINLPPWIASIAEAAPAAAEVATKAVPVSVSNWSPTAYGVWGILAIVFVQQVAKNIPALYDRWTERDGQVRGERLSRKATTEARLISLEERMSRMITALAFVANAVTTATNALDSDDHDERQRAKHDSLEMVGLATSALGKDDPFVEALERISRAASGTAQVMRPTGIHP